MARDRLTDEPGGAPAVDARRAAELAANLDDVRARVAAACAAAGRDPAEVTLIAVGKTFPAADVAHLVRLGVADVAESRDQEAAPKVAEVAALAERSGGHVRPRWHFVGQLQRNKANSVATYADVVHSLGRPALAAALASAADRAGRRLDVLLQVNLDPHPPARSAAEGGRAGVRPEELIGLAEAVTTHPALRLRGLMTVAPPGLEPAPAFARLAELSAELTRAHPDAGVISAGMSGDLEPAIASGASWVRVGTSLFGRRELVSDHVR